ncbi:EpsG family protein, partial [Acinetobacter stercoris]|uniref:EpsG family protein n=1 Tax=Acinetobacter stercoris TaxID=2126983 RepID=UPI001D183481
MLLLSICYVALSISFPSKWFRDRENYEIIAKYSNYFFYNLGDLSFTKEPVFLFINYLLTKITLFTNVPYFYVFFITSMMMFFLYKRSDSLLLFLLGLIALFIIPFTFHMQFVVLRQGIATVLFIYAIVCLKSNKTVLMLMLPLIHASFFFVLVLYYSYVFLKKYVSNILVISAIISIFSVVLFGVILGVAEYIGFYQLSYQDVLTIDSSGKAFVFNILILVFL